MKISKYLSNKEYRENFKKDYSNKTINRFNDVNMSMEEIYSGNLEKKDDTLI
jgi:hypothetical protein